MLSVVTDIAQCDQVLRLLVAAMNMVDDVVELKKLTRVAWGQRPPTPAAENAGLSIPLQNSNSNRIGDPAIMNRCLTISF